MVRVPALLAFVLAQSFSLTFSQTATFGPATQIAVLDNQNVTEGSGLAASVMHPGVLYTHNDGGDLPRLFAIDETTGNTLATLTLNQATNTDWEDISVGPCGGGESTSCIYIGDFGTRHGANAETIYKVMEPEVMATQSLDIDSTLTYQWPGQPQVETVMVDPTGEVYIISYSTTNAWLAHLPSSGWGSGDLVTVTNPVKIPVTPEHHHHAPLAGDISPSGQEVLVVYRHSIHYWMVSNGDYMNTLSQTPGQSIPTIHAAQGVAWDDKGSGFYLIQEGHNPPLYYHKRTTFK